MGHDRRLYRFVQDTRHGRITIAESEKIDPIVKSVTDYIARRLVEREKALASDLPQEAQQPEPVPAAAPIAKKPSPKNSNHGVQEIMGFIIDLLGTMALFILLSIGSYYAYMAVSAWLAVKL
jgi:hypothetical protein